VVSFIGKMGSGKSELAKEVSEKLFPETSIITSFATPIKYMYETKSYMHILGETEIPPSIDMFKVNNKLDNLRNQLEILDADTPKGDKPRRQYHLIGDTMRNLFGPSFFAEKLFKDFKRDYGIYSAIGMKIPDVLIIDDCRYNVEFEEIVKQDIEAMFVFCFVDEMIRAELCRGRGLKYSNHSSEDVYPLLDRMIDTGKTYPIETWDGRVLHFLAKSFTGKFISGSRGIADDIAILSHALSKKLNGRSKNEKDRTRMQWWGNKL